MHRCLQIYELVFVIFKYAFMEWDNDLERVLLVGRRTLLHLAATSRSFHNPALDLLWSQQDSVQVLLQTLPRKIWSFEEADYSDAPFLVSHFLVCIYTVFI